MRPAWTKLALLAMAAVACRSSSDVDSWQLVPTADSPIQGVRRANAIGVGDFDRDGRNDLAVLGSDPGELLVLLNAGSGRFEPSRQGVIPAGLSASGLGVGDVDGDGAADLVVSHHDDFELLVLLSAGDGTFRPRPAPTKSSREGKPHSHNLVLAEVNGDGRLDVIQAQADENVVLVLLGDGAGGFVAAPGSPFAAGSHPYTIVAADFDGDGACDFASPNLMSGDLTVALGQGSGKFSAPPGARMQLGVRPLGLAAGDVDDDGHADLVVNFDDVGTLGVLLGDGSGSFQRSSESLAVSGRCNGQVVADFDQDGIDDVLLPCIDEEGVAVWLGRPGGPSAASLRTFATPGTDSLVMAIAHLDEDAVLDVVTAGCDRSTLSILLGRSP